MAGDTLDLPSTDTPTTLTPLYPDTQNEAARSLSKDDRAAVMQDLYQLILDLKTRRFDPSTVASEKTCKAISKLLPACLDHEDERDQAFEILRTLMITSFSLLNECFIKGGSRNDIKRPNWVFAKGKDEQGRAMESLLSNCFWAVMAFMDALESAEIPEAQRNLAQHKAAIAEALFPAFEEFLTGENVDSFPPIPLRDIIHWCTIEARAAKEKFSKFGLKALAHIFASSRDYASCSLAYYLAGKRVEKAKENNVRTAKQLFLSSSYDTQSLQKLRDAWASLPFDGKAIKKFKFPFHDMLARSDIRQPQLFFVTSKEITVESRKMNLDKKGFISEGKYLLCLNDRSISCSLNISDGYHVLDIQLDTLLSCHSGNGNQLTFVTSGMPTTTPQILKNDPGKTIETVVQMEQEDIYRLQKALEHRYVPLLNSQKLNAVKKLHSGPQKISLSQEPIRIRDLATNSQDSEDSREKMQARAAEYAKIIAGISPDGTRDDLERPIESAPLSKIHPKANRQTEITERQVDALKVESKGLLDQSKPLSEEQKTAKQQKTCADTTRMSLDTSPDSDLPDKATVAPRNESTSGSDKSLKVATKPASKTQVTVEIISRRVSVGKVKVASTDTSTIQKAMESILPDEKNIEISTSDLSELRSSDEENVTVKSVKKSAQKRRIVNDSEAEYEPENREKPVLKRQKKVNEADSASESDNEGKPVPKTRKARDSGFDDLPKPKKTNTKSKASTESGDDTDYDDLSKAGIEEEKTKSTSAKKGRGTATRGRGRGRGKGKTTPATTVKRKAREETVDEVQMEEQEEQGRRTEKRVTRSRARAKPAVQNTEKPIKSTRNNEEQSDTEDESTEITSKKELSSPLPERKKVEKAAPSTTEVDLENDFFDRSKSTKHPKDINTFSQLVNQKRNPVLASKEQNKQDKSNPTTLDDSKLESITSARQDKPEHRQHTVSPEQAAVLAKEINDAFEDLLNETPSIPLAGKETDDENVPVPEFQEADQENEAIRNFTTLCNDHDMQADVVSAGDFFADMEAPLAQAPVQTVNTARRESLSHNLPIGTTAQMEVVESRVRTMEFATLRKHEEKVRQTSRKAKSIALTSKTDAVIVKHEITRMSETQNAPRPKTSDANANNQIVSESSMEVDAIVAESFEQASRTIIKQEGSMKDQSRDMSRDVSKNNVERQTVAESGNQNKQQAIEMFDSDVQEAVRARKSGSKERKRIAAIPKKLLEAFEEATQESADSDAEAQKPTRSARRGRSKAIPAKTMEVEQRTVKDNLNKTLSPVKTSTPHKGYDEEEHQTQLLENPLEALQSYQVEDKRRSPLKQAKQQHDGNTMIARRTENNDRGDNNEEEPDRLVDLSVKLTMLLVKNHRNELNAYKMSKNTGIDNIINVVATGCREAEQMDINFPQLLRSRNEDIHRIQSESMSPLASIIDTVKTEKAKVLEEAACVKESKELLKIKLVPDLFSNFKSLHRFVVK